MNQCEYTGLYNCMGANPAVGCMTGDRVLFCEACAHLALAMHGYDDPRTFGPYDMYHAAIVFGREHDAHSPGMGAVYWSVWRAARLTATALLAEARDAGVTHEQWERLRVVAARVATD